MHQRLSTYSTVPCVLLLCCWLAAPLLGQGKHQEEYDDADPWVGFEQTGRGPDAATVDR